ncbi:MAG: peptidoglycan DD-metalloendopeptidase family protein [Acidobacteria bacterium]|uniref:Peptidoglycan DD-metalloendopeptidase family protein n=1 Tax=Candidatus Polarisedimenticola svalbardensis TaxID=2886004 RepID=A0A8J6Y658_9BACT|nr:peptidoglycan DD-metalloendopeptidase family protein [Candidatus Polarisedimenticola svalbardensis]
MRIPSLILALVLPGLLVPAAGQERAPDRETRLRAVERHIVRLQGELDRLQARERGVLGQLSRIDAEITLREAQLQQTGIRMGELEEQIEAREAVAADLATIQANRETYLSFRVREMYKQGPGNSFRRSMISGDVEAFLEGLRYASFLSERDAKVIREYRTDAERLRSEQAILVTERERQQAVRTEAQRARNRLVSGRRDRSSFLTRLRKDSNVRKSALGELEEAAGELTNLVEDLATDQLAVVDMHTFRGLLDLPVDGAITERFGEIVHPRFKTRVPHPGLDIEADQGRRITGIFDGTVVYAAWLRGYGLTAILDHGDRLVSIYSHASVLLVEKGEKVLRGQVIGQVGETGSLKGPFLYFELRENGKAIDPAPWFR